MSNIKSQANDQRRSVSAVLPTSFGDGELILFDQMGDGKEHFAFALGTPSKDKKPLVRVHSECITGEVFGSQRCDCKWQLETAMRAISESANGGYIVYLRQEGRGIGVKAKLKAYNLQDEGYDTAEANEKLGFDADLRDYTIVKSMFLHFQVDRIKLMTNNPVKVQALNKLGIEIVERLPIETGQNDHNARYLATKAGKLGHLFTDK